MRFALLTSLRNDLFALAITNPITCLLKEALVPSSALPLGSLRSLKETSLLTVDPEDPRTGSLTHMVLAIPQSAWDGVDPETDAAAEAATGPVLGFVHLCVTF